MKHQWSQRIKSHMPMAIVGLMFFILPAVTSMADLSDGLVGYWPLDNDVTDTVGGHDGILAGGAAFVDDTERGGVLEVDGVDGRAEVPHADDLIFTQPESYTVSVWLNVLTLPGHWAGVVNKSRDAGPWYGLWINPQNQWVAGGTNINGSTVEANIWQHLALVQDGGANTRTIYIDGQIDFDGGAIDATGGGDLWMGGAKSVSEFLHARIDDVAIYSRSLAEDEVQSIAGGTNVAVEPAGKLTTTWAEIKR